MADFKVGTFNSPSGAGSVTLTLGFEMKVLMLWTSLNTAYDSASEQIHFPYGFGNAVNPAARRGVFHSRFDGLFFKNAAKSTLGNTTIIFAGDGANFSSLIVQQASITAISATEVTLTWTDSNAIYKYDYLAIGGAGVSCAIGSTTTRTTTGVQAIAHGLGAVPAVVGLYCYDGTNTSPAGYFGCAGFTDGTNQGVTAWHEAGTSGGAGGANPSSCHMYQRTNKLIAKLNRSTGALNAEGALFSLDATNLNIDWTTVDGVADDLNWFAITGITAQVGSFSQPGATGNQLIDNLNVLPEAIMYQSFGAITGTSPVNNIRYSRGITDGDAANQKCQAMLDDLGVTSVGTRRAMRIHSDDGCVYSAQPNGTSAATMLAQGTVSISSNSFTVDWDTVDATAREWIWVAFGEAVPADNITMTMAGGIILGGEEERNVFSGLYQLTLD
jgi:hypothetical protein